MKTDFARGLGNGSEFLGEVAGEIHGGMKDPDDLEGGVVDAEEDDVTALGGNLATREEVGPGTKLIWVAKDLFESGPESVEINFFLSWAPSLECVIADGLKVCGGGGGELQGHERCAQV